MQQIGEEDDYVVVFKMVAVRDRPSTAGKSIGALLKGHKVRGVPFLNAQKEPWLHLTSGDDNVSSATQRWMLVDGSTTSLGVGVLLEPLSSSLSGKKEAGSITQKASPATSPQQKDQKPTWYEVSHKRVVVRSSSSTDSPIIGYYQKGDFVQGTCLTFDNWKWLRLSKVTDASEEGYILIDGTNIGLGMLLTESANVNLSTKKHSAWNSLRNERTLDEDLTKWLFYPHGESCSYRVVLQHVMVRQLPSVNAPAGGLVKKGDVLAGEKRDEWLLLTPAIDNQRLSEGHGKWILIDGTSIGKGVLLERCIAEPEVKRCYMNAIEVKCPDKDREKCTLEVKPEDEALIEQPCSKGSKIMLVHELPENCKCKVRLCLKNSEKVLAASSWVETQTLEDADKSEEYEPAYDIMGELRLGCAQCSCPCYALDTNITLNSDMSDQRCARCGCNVTAHEIFREGQKKKKKSEPMLVDKAIALPKESIIRRWMKFDLPANHKEWPRLEGSFKEVVAWSDLHADMGANMEHLQQLPESKETVLLVAGDVATGIDCIETSLRLLQDKYGAVFYVPGNHDLWITKKDGYSSLHKFMILLELCEKLGVHTRPAFVNDSCAICPMFSWYKDNLVDGFKRDMADIAFDIQTMWPWDLTGRGDTQDAQQPEIADFFANLNTRRITLSPKRREEVTILTMSHFVPRQEVYPGPRRLCGVMGCREIEDQVRACGSSCHVFGHSHISVDKLWDGVRYVQHPLGYPNDFHRKVVPLRVWGVEAGRNNVASSSQSLVATHGVEIVKKIVEEIQSSKDKLLKRPPGRWSTGIDWDTTPIFDREKEWALQEALGTDSHAIWQMFRQGQSKNLVIAVRHFETLDEIIVTVANSLSIKQLKEHIVDKVGRGFPSEVMLTFGGESSLDDAQKLSSIEDRLEAGLFLMGISLAAHQEQIPVPLDSHGLEKKTPIDGKTVKDGSDSLSDGKKTTEALEQASQNADTSRADAMSDSIDLFIGNEVKLRINRSSNMKTVLDLKECICQQVKRGPASMLELFFEGDELLDQGSLLHLFDAWEPSIVHLELSASGLDLGPPRQVEIFIRNAASDDPQKMCLVVEDTFTLKEVRNSIALALEEKELSEVKLVKRSKEGGFINLDDEETLNGRTELLYLGRELPSAFAGLASSPSANVGIETVEVAPESADKDSEIEVVVHIDRELSLTEKFKVVVGSNVGALKQRIAEADPTGISKAADIGLKTEDRTLLDDELITLALTELDLCELL